MDINIGIVENSETSTMGVVTRQMSVLATEDICPVSTEDITSQMPSVARPDICFVSTHSVDVSEVSTVAMSQCSSRR